ncbi:unnamed protein product [Cyprideis torosa]|uniref:Hormone-sensitive lipase n=1 Tax=Cyprideis torosa TaxID=163714 RepID=A0A7R8WKV7_9CRUS|nr:unnamed protein product [Cyprideis torosa]CAG0903634.1 unnamed protein product [Cyprideis torosa]
MATLCVEAPVRNEASNDIHKTNGGNLADGLSDGKSENSLESTNSTESGNSEGSGSGNKVPFPPSSSELLRQLYEHVQEQVEYFKNDSSHTGQKLYDGFLLILKELEEIDRKLPGLRQVSQEFDFDEETPGNGYRSFLLIVDKAMAHCLDLSQKIELKRTGRLFKKGFYSREVDCWSQVISTLKTMLGHMEKVFSWSDHGNLYPHDYHAPEELLKEAESINQYCFYGRAAAFQFCPSMRRALVLTSVALASFSEGYYSDAKSSIGRTAYSLMASSKYYRNPELRARRIVNLTQSAEIGFCKAFWNLADTDFMTQLPGVVCPPVTVNIVFSIPIEQLSMPRWGAQDDTEVVEIPVPCSHFAPAPVQVRLVSSKRRVGMAGGAVKRAQEPPSPNLIVHVHGGGFVSCTSASHEIYLRQWARELDCPILSIDYSLAPEAPYPRALEEVFYVYCWALKNSHIFGATGEKVVLAGDSAGGNLITSCAMKCIEFGVRPPDGIMAIYCPMNLQFTPSPSRMLCLLDPLIPFGVMMRCLQSYAGHLRGSPMWSNLEAAAKLPLPEPRQEEEKVVRRKSYSGDSDSKQPRSLRRLKSQPARTKDPFTRFKENYLRHRSVSPDNRYIDDEHDDPEIEFQTRDLEGSNGHGSSGTVFGYIGDTLKRWRRSSQSGKEPTGEPESPSLDAAALDMAPPKSPVLEFTRFRVPRDPYLSPYVASDEVLAQLPTMTILSTHFDPCLDDCVMFAKRIKSVGVRTRLIIVDEDLPHGFLNFSVASKEAGRGTMKCIEAIRQLFEQP